MGVSLLEELNRSFGMKRSGGVVVWWYGVTDDSKLIEPAKNYFDGYMQRHFQGWEDSGAFTDRVWTGSKLIFIILFL